MGRQKGIKIVAIASNIYFYFLNHIYHCKKHLFYPKCMDRTAAKLIIGKVNIESTQDIA